jgi:ATP-dependent Clp protease ATP-binding subunit ClpA
MTTNAGATELASNSIGFTPQDHSTDGIEAIKKLFSPEFRNRLDSIIQFQSLPTEVIRLVVDKFIFELEGQLEAKDVALSVDDAAKQWLAKHGYDKTMGARPMARLIQEKIKKPMAEELLFGRLAEGGHIRVTAVDGELLLDVEGCTVQ